jgi:hypothetical protein
MARLSVLPDMRLCSVPSAMMILWLSTGGPPAIAQDAAGSSSSALDLSPQTAARSLHQLSQETPRPSREPSERSLSEGVPGLVRMDDATFGQKVTYQFNRAVWRILQFWKRPPESPRVRYFYIGRTVDVAIHRDGSYDVRDKRGLILTIVAAHSNKEPSLGPTSQVNDAYFNNTEGSPAKPAGVGIGFREPERMLQSILTGREPPNEEVRTFLEATRPLRERLLAREALRAQATASARMNEVLRNIWQGTGASERKREETFTLWDECSEDETGALARRHIEAFVHDIAARRGECPYAASDLARLNHKRRSKTAFAPCDAHDTGVAESEGALPEAQAAGDTRAASP